MLMLRAVPGIMKWCCKLFLDRMVHVFSLRDWLYVWEIWTVLKSNACRNWCTLCPVLLQGFEWPPPKGPKIENNRLKRRSYHLCHEPIWWKLEGRYWKSKRKDNYKWWEGCCVGQREIRRTIIEEKRHWGKQVLQPGKHTYISSKKLLENNDVSTTFFM